MGRPFAARPLRPRLRLAAAARGRARAAPAGRVARWRPFDWPTWQGLAEEVLTRDPAPVVVLDMVYSGRPELADLVDLAILVALDDEERRARLVAREGTAYMERWWALWDSAEEYYFGEVRPPASFDLMLRDVRPQTTAAAFGAPRDRDPSEGKSVPGPRLG